MLDTEGLREFAEIEEKLAKFNTEVNKLKARKEEIGPDLIENLATEGIDNIKINGRTLYSHVRIVAKTKSKQDAIDALKDAGFKDYVAEGFNANSLNALLSEMSRNGEQLPDAFEGKIQTNSVISLRSKKS